MAVATSLQLIDLPRWLEERVLEPFDGQILQSTPRLRDGAPLCTFPMLASDPGIG